MDRLSDEILLLITKKVSLKDQFFSIQYVNKRFYRLVWDNLSRCLMLNNQTWLKNEYLKKILLTIEKEKVTTLSLRNCYWLNSSILKPVKSCTNLKILNLLGCTITCKALLHILSGTAILEQLSFTATYDVIAEIGVHFQRRQKKLHCALSKLHIQFDEHYKSKSYSSIHNTDAINAFAVKFIQKQLFNDSRPPNAIYLEWLYYEANSIVLDQLANVINQAENVYLSKVDMAPVDICKQLCKVGLHPVILPHQHRQQFYSCHGLGLVKGSPSPVSYTLQERVWYANLRYLHIEYCATELVSNNNTTTGISCCETWCDFTELPSLEYLGVVRVVECLEGLQLVKPSFYHLVWGTNLPRLKILNLSTYLCKSWKGKTAVYSKIRELGKTWAQNLGRFSKLEALNLAGMELEGKSILDFLYSESFPKSLRSLALSLHSICGTSRALDSDFKGPDQKRFKSDTKPGILLHLAQICPNLEELEIYGLLASGSPETGLCKTSSCCYYTNWVNAAGFDLKEISLFKNLNRLTLVDFAMVRDFSFFQEIGKNCKQLRSLRIGNMGMFSNANFLVHLKSMLYKLRDLQELSIWHGVFGITSDFLSAVARCRHLQRFSVKTFNGRMESNAYDTLINMILKCKNLVHVVIISKELCNVKVKQVQREVKKLILQRPALQVNILQYCDLPGNPKALPNSMKDLNILKTRVAIHSPTQYEI